MKIKYTKPLLIIALLCNTFFCFSQTTYVPGDVFEYWLEFNDMGNGIYYDDLVLTANINTVTSLNISGLLMYDLTGIEDFAALTHLNASSNQLRSLDLSNNTALTSLDCNSNQLTSLNIANTNNANFTALKIHDNPYYWDGILSCVIVDNQTIATNWNAGNYPTSDFSVDSETQFNVDCALSLNDVATTAISYYPNPVKETLYITSQKESIHSIQVYNLLGKKVITTKETSRQQTINMTGLQAGVYFVKVYTDRRIANTIKIIKE
ncbi:MAG: T9SS type A sorting domain-containing protein [Oceanihabitans sp.]